MRDIKQYVEIFHLLFLSQLSQKLDKQLYALKGGCNLRFYFKSIRYSEDMDLDIQIIQKETLQNKVNRILESPALNSILKSYDMAVQQISEPKQTNTVQRWKIAIKTPVTQMALPTKIEFSRRTMDNRVTFSVVDRTLLTAYELPLLLSTHYTQKAMWEQKVLALANRTQTQARDIFDLYLLLGQIQHKASDIKTSLDILELAKNNISLLNYNDYKAQVVAYLLPQYQEQFGAHEIWQQIVNDVTQALE